MAFTVLNGWALGRREVCLRQLRNQLVYNLIGKHVMLHHHHRDLDDLNWIIKQLCIKFHYPPVHIRPIYVATS